MPSRVRCACPALRGRWRRRIRDSRRRRRARSPGVSSSTRFVSAARKRRSWETSSSVPSKPASARDQHLLGREIEMVGGLVEHQKIGRVVEHARQHEPRLLAAREQPAALLDLVAGEAEAARERAQRADRRGRERGLERLEDGLVAVEHLHRLLREVAELHGGAQRDAAGSRALASPATSLSSVDLPAPFAPITHQRSWRRTQKSSPSKTTRSP